ncbi:MAG: TlpA family protein disulfide reductase, partial [Gammaproteobacteria bacterium]|nr:TlpA family protein disulfide reductase [Gammaproteobacteria bacterium]
MKYFVFALALLAHVGVVQADELQEGEGGWRVVNYWSKSCAPCRVEIPEFNYLHDA